MTIPKPEEVIFKTTKGNAGEDVTIPLDVYLPLNAGSTPPTPLIWIHSGGFLQGSKRFIPEHLLRSVNQHNFAVIAPDYRLAPQVDMAAVLADVHDCIQFVLSGTLSSQIEQPLDTSRYVLSGSSAGGWAALLFGLDLLPSMSIPTPAAIVAIYPVTTVHRPMAPYFYEPIRPLTWPYAPTAKKGDIVPSEPLREHLRTDGTVRTEAHPAIEPIRSTMYNYSRQEGNFPSLILREGQKAEEYCVPMQIEKQIHGGKKKRTPSLVFIVYGDADIQVDTNQSKMVIDALRKSEINIKTHVEPGKAHLWDIVEPQTEIPSLWESAKQAAKAFQ